MLKTKTALISISMAVFFGFIHKTHYPVSLRASEFLTWKYKSQAFYIETSIGMASLVAAQNDKAHAKCLEAWYYEDEDAGNRFILDTMRTHPDYHPRGVILGVLQKKCGSFDYSAR